MLHNSFVQTDYSNTQPGPCPGFFLFLARCFRRRRGPGITLAVDRRRAQLKHLGSLGNASLTMVDGCLNDFPFDLIIGAAQIDQQFRSAATAATAAAAATGVPGVSVVTVIARPVTARDDATGTARAIGTVVAVSANDSIGPVYSLVACSQASEAAVVATTGTTAGSSAARPIATTTGAAGAAALRSSAVSASAAVVAARGRTTVSTLTISVAVAGTSAAVKTGIAACRFAT